MTAIKQLSSYHLAGSLQNCCILAFWASKTLLRHAHYDAYFRHLKLVKIPLPKEVTNVT